MNADAFLALVDRFPLPWKASPTRDEMLAYHAPGAIFVVPHDLAGELADAAPALAAAAIRLLRAVEMTNADACNCCERPNPEIGPIEHEPDCALLALRAALPEELRP